ncbi:MAG: helix-turn-helix transcriptional regulator [Acidovorax sp.]|nr:helix-turn-helix transcriptional regulator [Acidovorax sp.]
MGLESALTQLLGAVADEPRWARALDRYAASFRVDGVGGAFLAQSLAQLNEWGAEFAAHPQVDYWMQAPASSGGPALLALGESPQASQQYVQHFRQVDPLQRMFEAHYTSTLESAGAWVVADSGFHTSRQFRQTAFYNDFLRVHGEGPRMFAGSRNSVHPNGNLFMFLFRGTGEEVFTASEIERFTGEFTSVQRAAFLHREVLSLRARTRGLERLMEQMPLGLVFLDTAGRLLHANARARRLWDHPAAAGVRALRTGAALQSTADPALRALFLRSLAGLSGCLALSGDILLVSLSLHDLAALGLRYDAPGVAWVLVERSLDSRAAVDLVRQAYRLSETETLLLQALMRGQTPQEFADARGVRITTARTQLSALLAKTATQRQQDLVALVARFMLLTPGSVPPGGD